jgi:carboxymethylenebutenolidase
MRCLLVMTAAALLVGLAARSVAVQSGSGDIEGKKVKFVNGKIGFQALEFVPPGKGPFPAVIVVHGDFGLTPWAKKQCRRLATKGYDVLALDLYDGQLPKDVEEAHILERGLEEGMIHAQLKAAVDRLSQLPAVRKDAIGILGWDMGGGYALDAAIRDQRLKAAVNCYGRLTTDPKQLANMTAALLGLFAGKDEGISPATIEKFKAALKKAGKQATLHVFPDSQNGFMDPDSPYLEGRADAAVIADAWSRIDKHLAEHLR